HHAAPGPPPPSHPYPAAAHPVRPAHPARHVRQPEEVCDSAGPRRHGPPPPRPPPRPHTPTPPPHTPYDPHTPPDTCGNRRRCATAHPGVRAGTPPAPG